MFVHEASLGNCVIPEGDGGKNNRTKCASPHRSCTSLEQGRVLSTPARKATANTLASSRAFSVAADPSEQMRFVTSPPSHASLSGSITPPFGLRRALSCRSRARRSPFAPSVITKPCGFSLAGTCTLDVRQSGSSKDQGPEATQSFTIHGPRSANAKLGTLAIEIYYEPFVLPVTTTGPQGVEKHYERPEERLWSGDETVSVLRLGSRVRREVTVEHGQVVLRLEARRIPNRRRSEEAASPNPDVPRSHPGERSAAKLHVLQLKR